MISGPGHLKLPPQGVFLNWTHLYTIHFTHMIHLTIYTFKYTLYNMQYTLYSTEDTLYTKLYTHYIIYYILYTIH